MQLRKFLSKMGVLMVLGGLFALYSANAFYLRAG
jgi:hypothetical protein